MNSSANINTALFSGEGISFEPALHTNHTGSCKCGGKGSKCKSKKPSSVLKVK